MVPIREVESSGDGLWLAATIAAVALSGLVGVIKSLVAISSMSQAAWWQTIFPITAVCLFAIAASVVSGAILLRGFNGGFGWWALLWRTGVMTLVATQILALILFLLDWWRTRS